MWEMKATRDAFGEALVELGKENRKIVVLSGDLEDSTRADGESSSPDELLKKYHLKDVDIVNAVKKVNKRK